MDRTDYQIINILQGNCRRTLRNIGVEIALTPPAIAERIRRMEESGIIQGYRAEINRARLGYNVTGFIFVAVESKKYNSFCDFCARQDSVIAFYHVVGVFNALLRFAVHDTTELDGLLSSLKVYGDSRTSIELQTLFEKKDVPLEL